MRCCPKILSSSNEQGCGRRIGWRKELKSLRLYQRWVFTGSGPRRLRTEDMEKGEQ